MEIKESDSNPPHEFIEQFQNAGIKVKVINPIDKKLTITGKWNEFFEYPLPANIEFSEHNCKFEYIFNKEAPHCCVRLDCFNILDECTLGSSFSVKDPDWFFHIYLSLRNDIVMFEIRARDHRQPNSNPYKVLELAKKLNFKNKFYITLQALSKVIRQKKLTGELGKDDLNARVQLNE